jgi:hypothetical protein
VCLFPAGFEVLLVFAKRNETDWGDLMGKAAWRGSWHLAFQSGHSRNFIDKAIQLAKADWQMMELISAKTEALPVQSRNNNPNELTVIF